MKLKPLHARFLANKIITDLSRSSIVRITAPMPNLNKIATEVILNDIKEEYSIESRARELLEENQDRIENEEIDERQFFSMVKKQLARERGFLLSKDERYSKLAHDVLDALFEEKYIDFNVPENVVKNHILDSIYGYLKFNEDVYDNVMEKMRNYKKKLVAGSEEYELIFTRLYEEEIAKRG